MCSIPARPIASRLAAASCVPRAGPPGGSRPGRRPRRRTIRGFVAGPGRGPVLVGGKLAHLAATRRASHFARRSGDGTIGCIAGGQPGACALARSRDRHRQRCPVSGLAFSAGARAGVEVQGISAAMARRSFAWNAPPIGSRSATAISAIRRCWQAGVLRSGDRHTAVLPDGDRPAVRSDPAGPLSLRASRRRRGVLRGGRPRTGPGAPFVACEAWIQRERVEPAGRAAGLALSHWREVIPREGKAPLFVVFALTVVARAGVPVRPPPLVVRDRRADARPSSWPCARPWACGVSKAGCHAGQAASRDNRYFRRASYFT